MLGTVDRAGRVVTGDAAFCQRELSAQVVRQGGACFWVVKQKQPTLLEDLRVLFAERPRDEPLPSSLRYGRRGERDELRLRRCALALVGDTDWPRLGYACPCPIGSAW